MDLILKLLLRMFVVLNLFVTFIQPVPSYTCRCCRDGQKGEQGDPGIRGQKGSQGQKGARGLPGTCSQQMVERIDLTSQSGDKRIRSRRDRSDEGEEEEEGVKSVLTTLFGRCVDAVLLADEEESSAFRSRISVVKGEKGEKGNQGDSIMGEVGLPGPPGPTGPPGMKGERGEMGDMGIKGERGDKGEMGCKGPMGPMGNTGARGPVGPAGPAGSPGPRGETGQTAQTGFVYTRWAERMCPLDATLLYDGIIVQAANMLTNLLCIPKDSTTFNQSDVTSTTTTTPPSHITRMEPLLYTNRMGVTDAIPCALCHVTNQSTIFTFSGRSTCPGDWTRQYSGHLITSYELSTTDVLCADERLSREIQWRNANTGAVIRNGVNMLETVCGEGVASCQGYEAGQLMPCVVCSN